MHGQGGGLSGQRQDHVLPGAQIERAVEVTAAALRRDPHVRGLSHRRPNAGEGRLKVEAELIHAQDDPLRMLLQKIGHFFSTSAWN